MRWRSSRWVTTGDRDGDREDRDGGEDHLPLGELPPQRRASCSRTRLGSLRSGGGPSSTSTAGLSSPPRRENSRRRPDAVSGSTRWRAVPVTRAGATRTAPARAGAPARAPGPVRRPQRRRPPPRRPGPPPRRRPRSPPPLLAQGEDVGGDGLLDLRERWRKRNDRDGYSLLLEEAPLRRHGHGVFGHSCCLDLGPVHEPPLLSRGDERRLVVDRGQDRVRLDLVDSQRRWQRHVRDVVARRQAPAVVRLVEPCRPLEQGDDRPREGHEPDDRGGAQLRVCQRRCDSGEEEHLEQEPAGAVSRHPAATAPRR